MPFEAGLFPAQKCIAVIHFAFPTGYKGFLELLQGLFLNDGNPGMLTMGISLKF
jgi:hypothetical protein